MNFHGVQFVNEYGTECHAGPKAQRDVAEILKNVGLEEYAVCRRHFGGLMDLLIERGIWLIECFFRRFLLKGNEVYFLQYPSDAWSKSPLLRLITPGLKKRKQIKLISLFHDFSSLRWGSVPLDNRMLSAGESALIELSDAVIVHNESMVKALVERGIDEAKLLPLQVFDYLTPCEPRKDRSQGMSVVIAGCLAPDKVGYLHFISQISDVQWNLYGVKFDANRLCGKNIAFKGCFSPEELPSKLEGSYGLIWDGPDADTCAGDLGNYLRINNPHKLSLYVVSGIPVLIWDQAAAAEFVKRNGIGICIKSLREIPALLRSISAEEYRAMIERECELSKRLRQGWFLKSAMEGAFSLVK